MRDYPRRHPDRDPRSLLPRQRHRLDPRARPRPRHPARGQLHLLPQAEGTSPQPREERGTPRARSRSRWRRSGWAPPPRRARRNRKPASSATRTSSTSRPTACRPRRRSSSPVGERLGHQRRRVHRALQELRRQAAHQRSDLQACRRAASSASSAPNGAGKTTLFRMITGQETPDGGQIQVGESVKLGYVDQSRDKLDGKKNVWEEISDGQGHHLSRQARDQLARLHRRLQLQGRRPAEEGGPALRRRAQPRAPRQDA